MKMIDFNKGTLLVFDETPPFGEEALDENICCCQKKCQLQYDKKNTAKKECLSERGTFCDDGMVLPFSLLELAKMEHDVQVEVYDGTMIATKSEMNVLELLQTIETLEDKIEEYHRCLLENFIEDKFDGDYRCDFCNSYQYEGGNASIIAKQLKQMGISGKKASLLDISQNMLQRLVDMGLCLDEINFAIMEDEIIFLG